MNSSAAVAIVLAIGAAVAIWYFYFRKQGYIAKCNKPLQRQIPGGCACVPHAQLNRASNECECEPGYYAVGNQCIRNETDYNMEY